MTAEELLIKLQEDISWLGYNETEREIVSHIQCAIKLLKEQEAEINRLKRTDREHADRILQKMQKVHRRYCGQVVKWDD